MTSKVYISGPMTGLPNMNFPAFNKAEATLKQAGFIAVNPACLPQGLEYSDYMKLDILLLSMCDSILLLEGWQHSKGARAELSYALSVGLKVQGAITTAELAQFSDPMVQLVG